MQFAEREERVMDAIAMHKHPMPEFLCLLRMSCKCTKSLFSVRGMNDHLYNWHLWQRRYKNCSGIPEIVRTNAEVRLILGFDARESLKNKDTHVFPRPSKHNTATPSFSWPALLECLP